MSIYNKVVSDMKMLGYMHELYRFQGLNNAEYFDMKNNKLFSENTGRYYYFSKGINHHKYFINKKLKQLIFEISINDTNKSLDRYSLNDLKRFKEICELIENSEVVDNLWSTGVIVNKMFLNLLINNCVDSDKKSFKSAVEKVDSKVFGGGFGLVDDWLKLLNHTSFFTAKKQITRGDIIQYLKSMRASNMFFNKDCLDFFFMEREYSLNVNIFNNFIKYEIMNDLENIVEKMLCSAESDLSKYPNKTISQIVKNYQLQREKVILSLEENYNKKIR